MRLLCAGRHFDLARGMWYTQREKGLLKLDLAMSVDFQRDSETGKAQTDLSRKYRAIETSGEDTETSLPVGRLTAQPHSS